jgi:hypothetical protein
VIGMIVLLLVRTRGVREKVGPPVKKILSPYGAELK